MSDGWTPLRCTHCTVSPEPGPRRSAGQPRQGMQQRGDSAIACSAWTCLVRRLRRHQLPSAFAATPQPLPACRRLGFHELQHAVVHVCQGQCVTCAHALSSRGNFSCSSLHRQQGRWPRSMSTALDACANWRCNGQCHVSQGTTGTYQPAILLET